MGQFIIWIHAPSQKFFDSFERLCYMDDRNAQQKSAASIRETGKTDGGCSLVG